MQVCHVLRIIRSILVQKLFKFRMSSSVEIHAQPPRVWDVLTNLARWPRWSRVCTEVWSIPEHDLGEVGTKFGFKLRMGGRQIPFNVTVSRIETGGLIEWRSTKFSITAIRSISIESSGKSCRVIDSKLFTSPFIPIGLSYPRWLIRRMTDSWLDDLKIESERDSLS